MEIRRFVFVPIANLRTTPVSALEFRAARCICPELDMCRIERAGDATL